MYIEACIDDFCISHVYLQTSDRLLVGSRKRTAMSQQLVAQDGALLPPPVLMKNGCIDHSKLLAHLNILDTVGK